MASCVLVTAYLFLLLGFMACGVNFFAPFWKSTVNENKSSGLWGQCQDRTTMVEEDSYTRFTCIWFFENDFGWERIQEVWFLACQVLDAFGIVTVFAIFFVASIHLCCSCCKESISLLKAIGVVLIFGAALITAALGAYAGMSYKEEKTSINSQVSRFEWGFWIGVPGAILVLLSAVLYLFESCRYDGYESGHREIV